MEVGTYPIHLDLEPLSAKIEKVIEHLNTAVSILNELNSESTDLPIVIDSSEYTLPHT